jgi:hypothetical protein
LEFITAQRQHPSRYKLLVDNCMNWAAEVAQKAGQTVPTYKNIFGVATPEALADSLASIRTGFMSNGGLVQSNNSFPKTTASGAPDPPSPAPPCCDVDAIAGAMATNAQAVAQELQVRFSQHQLPADQLNASGTYRVTVSDTNPAENLYEVAWGDGTTTTGERPNQGSTRQVNFVHTYSSSPTAPLEVFILENGQLNEYVRALAPSQGGTGKTTLVTEPPPPPQHSYS